MHEFAITQSMFEIVMNYAREAQAKKVTEINLVIGEMTGVVVDSVKLYLDFLSKDTIVEGAMISIKSITATAKCRNCGNTFELKEYDWMCPDCKEFGFEIISGKELFIKSIEVE